MLQSLSLYLALLTSKNDTADKGGNSITPIRYRFMYRKKRAKVLGNKMELPWAIFSSKKKSCHGLSIQFKERKQKEKRVRSHSHNPVPFQKERFSCTDVFISVLTELLNETDEVNISDEKSSEMPLLHFFGSFTVAWYALDVRSQFCSICVRGGVWTGIARFCTDCAVSTYLEKPWCRQRSWRGG